MLTVDDNAAGPHDASLDHERIVLQARDVGFDWADLPVHYVQDEPFGTHFADVLHLLLLAPGTKPRWRDWFDATRRGLVPGPLAFIRVIAPYYRRSFHPSQLGGVERAVNYLAVSPAARASH